MQQVMDMMQGLQEAMAASKVEQERMQADLDGIFMKFFLNQCRVWGGSNE